MPAVAMTDHGNIFGAVNFVNAATKKACEANRRMQLYVCKNSITAQPLKATPIITCWCWRKTKKDTATW